MHAGLAGPLANRLQHALFQLQAGADAVLDRLAHQTDVIAAAASRVDRFLNPNAGDSYQVDRAQVRDRARSNVLVAIVRTHPQRPSAVVAVSSHSTVCPALV